MYYITQQMHQIDYFSELINIPHYKLSTPKLQTTANWCI